jgi:PhzF family phenazine biosynthesis protein
MELEINVIDAFTDVAFKGNSAAVIITKDWLCDEIMQSIAIENNLSESAFVLLRCLFNRNATNSFFKMSDIKINSRADG